MWERESEKRDEEKRNNTLHLLFQRNRCMAYPVHHDDVKSNENCNLHHGNSIRMVARICYDLAIALSPSLSYRIRFWPVWSFASIADILCTILAFQMLWYISPGTHKHTHMHTHKNFVHENFAKSVRFSHKICAFSLASPMINKLLFPLIFVWCKIE